WLLLPCGINTLSWNDARSSYLQALTDSSDTLRLLAQIETFRALGGVMHLIQDLSNPAHVRNDSHLPFPSEEGFHAWGAEYWPQIYTMSPVNPAPALLALLVPARLMDCYTYYGTLQTLGLT